MNIAQKIKQNHATFDLKVDSLIFEIKWVEDCIAEAEKAEGTPEAWDADELMAMYGERKALKKAYKIFTGEDY